VADSIEPDKKSGKISAKGDERKPKKVTAGYLERAALHYLGRFSSSEHNLRQVLERKIYRRSESPVTEEHKGWIEDVVRKCIKYGYLNDETYAARRGELLQRRGKPVRSIGMDLHQKGIDSELVKQVLAQLEGETEGGADARAAAMYVKRRRFGPYRRESTDLSEKVEKELAAMMRAGFHYELARKTLALDTEAIADLLV
jgi:regulatory protein